MNFNLNNENSINKINVNNLNLNLNDNKVYFIINDYNIFKDLKKNKLNFENNLIIY